MALRLNLHSSKLAELETDFRSNESNIVDSYAIGEKNVDAFS